MNRHGKTIFILEKLEDYKNSVCHLCKSMNVDELISWNEYVINKCKSCNLIFSTPLPNDSVLNDFYQGFLYNLPNEDETGRLIEKKKKELFELFKFHSNVHSKRFLDYGGGTGIAYKSARDIGLQSYYYDLDKEAEKFVKSVHGLKDEFIVNNLSKYNNKFDYILSDNVIEHLKNPVQHIKELGNALNINGILIVKTPHGGNTESYFNPLITIKGYFLRAIKHNSFMPSFKAYLIRFWHCDPPRHIYSFSKINLELIAKEAGFKGDEIEIGYYAIPLFKYSLFEIFMDFRERRSIKSFVIRVFLIPFLLVEAFMKLLHFLLLSSNVLSKGGIILKIKRS